MQKNTRQLLGTPGTLPGEHRQSIAEVTCGARSALSCDTLRSLKDAFNQVEPHSLAQAINQWLAAHSDLLPKSLALDGKDLGGKGKLGALVALCDHQTGAPLTMLTYSGQKDDCELPVSQTLLEQTDYKRRDCWLYILTRWLQLVGV